MGLRHLKRSPLYIVSVMALGVSLPLDAGAWGFGRAQTSAVLGVPLDFNVALRLEQGEAPPECLAVDVTVGDIPLPRSTVSAVLDVTSPTPFVRVRTSQAIDEPLVQVNLSAGCSSRVTRRFTLFADPPGHMATPGLANAEVLASTAPPAPNPTQAPPAVPVGALSTSVPPARTVPATAPLGGSGSDASGRSVSAAPSAAVAPAGQESPKGSPAATTQKQPPSAPRKTADPAQLANAGAAGPERPASPATARPRLQLDAPTVATKSAGAGPEAAKSAALLAAEEAASAARAAASAAEGRAAAMEKSIEALRQEAKANRESLARLTQALQEAQSTPEVPLAMWGALAGLAALSALLMIRLRRQTSSTGQAPWWSAGSAASDHAGDAPESLGAASAADVAGSPSTASVTPAALLDQSASAERQDEAIWSSVAPAAGAGAGGFGLTGKPAQRELPPLADPEELDAPGGGMDRTQLLPPSASSVSAPIQGVSIEELLDLEQQVEFFTVLGQDDAALSLLVEHLRSTGGTYPLPYLKLMEIYRQKGDEDSYERTRDRFNQRFNAVAPAWGAAAARDRHLEDLPDVLRRIEQVWPRPVDAMALLENMLVRTEGGTLLDMSALGEVLFLFTLARDLHEQEEGAAAPVDVLLPLDDVFDMPSARASAAGASAATQFSDAAFAKSAPAAVLAGLSSVAASSPEPAADDVDHFDLPLGEPVSEASFGGQSYAGQDLTLQVPAVDDPWIPASIDLPTFSTSSDTAQADRDTPLGAGSLGYGQDLAPVGLDLPTVAAPSAGSSTPALEANPFLEPLSFDLPELEAIQEPLPSKSAAAGPVDLDISLDGLELEPVAPNLSPGEEQAASNFGLFNDSPSPGKPR